MALRAPRAQTLLWTVIRDTSTGRGVRHSHASGVARAHGCEHDDLHARAQSGRVGGAESGGPAGWVIWCMTALLAGRGLRGVGSGAGE